MIMRTIRTAQQQTKRPTAPRGKWDRWTDRFSLFSYYGIFGGMILAAMGIDAAIYLFNAGVVSLIIYLLLRR